MVHGVDHRQQFQRARTVSQCRKGHCHQDCPMSVWEKMQASAPRIARAQYPFVSQSDIVYPSSCSQVIPVVGHLFMWAEQFCHILTRRDIMSAIRAKRGPFANNRVNPHEQNELKYWCQKFTCNEFQLKNAVTAVGTSPEAVRHFLKDKTSS
jgi:hypothetical protein